MLLTITDIGKQRETDALANGDPLPKLSKLVIGSGPAAEPPGGADALTDLWHETPILVVDRLSAGAVKLSAEIPSDVEGYVREVGLLMEDGTLYAYAPYQPESGGLFKGAGFAFSFYVILSREDVEELTIEYAAIDVGVLAASVAAEARAAIDADFGAYWIAITRSFSSLNRETLALINANNKESGRYVRGR